LTSGVRQTTAAPAEDAPARSRGRTGQGGPAASLTTAVLLATAPGDGNAPAAALPWGDATVLRRLLEQLAELGVRSTVVITRPEWEDLLRPSLEGLATVAIRTSTGTAGDLRAIATVAREGAGAVLVAGADVVTHREALAGLLKDPRVGTGALCSSRRLGRSFAFRTRTVRGRVVSASSPYHAVHRPTMRFLDVLKVAPANRAALAEVADRLAALAEPPVSSAWQEELRSKRRAWRLQLARLAGGIPEEAPPDIDPEAVALSDDDAAELGRWLSTAPEDAASLVLVGLVRSQVHVGVSHLRDLFWARPLSRGAAEEAAQEITGYDEDRVLLDSAVKANDGFFTTFLVSPYSKYIARWAARRGWTPNQVTTVSLAIGVLAAAAFATGERAGLIAGAILLQVAFTTDCVDGQLARYTRQFSRLGAWLDSIFDRTKEYLAYAGLAIGASVSGDPVWVLAGAALALQTVRHEIDFTYPIAQHQALAFARQPPLEQTSDRRSSVVTADPEAEHPAPDRGLGARIVLGGLAVWRALNRWSGARWIKRIVGFPIGERFAAISITAAVGSARTTFVVLLAWGGFSAAYKMTGRVLRSVVR
jgi:hypothetical protein